jgi:hypothetical protein
MAFGAGGTFGGCLTGSGICAWRDKTCPLPRRLKTISAIKQTKPIATIAITIAKINFIISPVNGEGPRESVTIPPGPPAVRVIEHLTYLLKLLLTSFSLTLAMYQTCKQ